MGAKKQGKKTRSKHVRRKKQRKQWNQRNRETVGKTYALPPLSREAIETSRISIEEMERIRRM